MCYNRCMTREEETCQWRGQWWKKQGVFGWERADELACTSHTLVFFKS